MTRSCTIRDDQLVSFAAGSRLDLDAHVAGCDECQAFLADLWEGELAADLVEPVVQYLRLELYLLEATRTGAAVAARMARAMLRYLDPALGEEDDT